MRLVAQELTVMVDDDTGRSLSSVLQGKDSVVREFADVRAGLLGVKNTENAADTINLTLVLITLHRARPRS